MFNRREQALIIIEHKFLFYLIRRLEHRRSVIWFDRHLRPLRYSRHELVLVLLQGAHEFLCLLPRKSGGVMHQELDCLLPLQLYWLQFSPLDGVFRCLHPAQEGILFRPTLRCSLPLPITVLRFLLAHFKRSLSNATKHYAGRSLKVFPQSFAIRWTNMFQSLALLP